MVIALDEIALDETALDDIALEIILDDTVLSNITIPFYQKTSTFLKTITARWNNTCDSDTYHYRLSQNYS